MGTDSLFHKRRAKNAEQLKRRASRREAYAKILIVCEGSKTEPRYFGGIRDHYCLNTANVEICGDCDSDPVSVVNHAKRRYQEEKNAGNPYDKVFCVFDKDSHANYLKALNAIASATPLGQLEFAKRNAERALRAAQGVGSDNPTTRVHELVQFMQAIK